jgi:hypothetical protein
MAREPRAGPGAAQCSRLVKPSRRAPGPPVPFDLGLCGARKPLLLAQEGCRIEKGLMLNDLAVPDPLHDAGTIPEARFQRRGHGRRHCRIDQGGTAADFGSDPRMLAALGAFRRPGWPRKRQSGYRGSR